MPDRATCHWYVAAEPPFYPAMVFECDSEISLNETLRGFAMQDAVRIDTDAVADLGDEVVRLRVQMATENRFDPDLDYFIPSLKRRFSGPRPGLSYELGVLRFEPEVGGRAWISNRVSDSSNYFVHCIRPLITHACALRGNAVFHSGLIEMGGKGFLMPGQSNSGKTSLSLFSTLVGGTIVSDDLVLIAQEDGQFYGRTFRDCFLVRQGTYDVIPESVQSLAEHVDAGGEAKYCIRRNSLGNSARKDAEIHAIVLPSIAGNEDFGRDGFEISEVEKSRAVAQTLNGVDAAVLIPGLDSERKRVLAMLTECSKKLPCFQVRMSSAFLQMLKKTLKRCSGKSVVQRFRDDNSISPSERSMKQHQMDQSAQIADANQFEYQAPSFDVTDITEVVKLENGIGSMVHSAGTS